MGSCKLSGVDLPTHDGRWLMLSVRLSAPAVRRSIVSYCYANLEPSDAVLNTEPNPLAQIINLRGQAEKAAKTQQMYDERVGGWLTWEDVQKARVKCFEKLDESQWGTPAEKRFALRDATAISLLSLIPPDRVGCIRKASALPSDRSHAPSLARAD
jgi:hypothetical protein